MAGIYTASVTRQSTLLDKIRYRSFLLTDEQRPSGFSSLSLSPRGAKVNDWSYIYIEKKKRRGEDEEGIKICHFKTGLGEKEAHQERKRRWCPVRAQAAGTKLDLQSPTHTTSSDFSRCIRHWEGGRRERENTSWRRQQLHPDWRGERLVAADDFSLSLSPHPYNGNQETQSQLPVDHHRHQYNIGNMALSLSAVCLRRKWTTRNLSTIRGGLLFFFFIH